MFTRGDAMEIFKPEITRKGAPGKLRIKKFLTNNIRQRIVSIVVFQVIVFFAVT